VHPFELSYMILLHGEVENGNAAASRLYAERYQQRGHQNLRLIISLEHPRETDHMPPSIRNPGKTQSHTHQCGGRCSTCRNDPLVLQVLLLSRTKWSASRHHIPERTVVWASLDQLFHCTYTMFTLCNCRWIMGVEKRRDAVSLTRLSRALHASHG
jgi:hypothetical protein